jgi:hypothetical protein
MNDREKADVLRKAADIMSTEWGNEPIDEMRDYADALDPPYRLDRSLRGLVMAVVTSAESIYWADDDGLHQFLGGVKCITWDEVVDRRYKVTKLRILQPGEVVAKIPPVAEWPDEAYTYTVGGWFRDDLRRHQQVISRLEAERMEAE